MNEYNSVESCVLATLIRRDLHDKDYDNAIILSERLFAIDNQNNYYRFLYATCLFYALDYYGCYMLLQNNPFAPCVNLFAKSCYFLSYAEKDREKKEPIVKEAIQAIAFALDQVPNEIVWEDELANPASQEYYPSRSSMLSLMGDLYVLLENINAAEKAYKSCLEMNPYKISTYFKLCDIIHDVTDFENSQTTDTIFKDFPHTLDLSASIDLLPPSINGDCIDIIFKEEESMVDSDFMPETSADFQEVTLDQLKAEIIHLPRSIDSNILGEIKDRGTIELMKDEMLETAKKDIKILERSERTRKKQGLNMDLPDESPEEIEKDFPYNEINEASTDEEDNTSKYVSLESYKKRFLEEDTRSISAGSNKRKKIENEEYSSEEDNASQISLPESDHSIYSIRSVHSIKVSKLTNKTLIDGMNRVVRLLCVIANGYRCMSVYHDTEAVQGLRLLDDCQYNSGRILSILGKAYYDVGDYQTAYVYFNRSFYIAPWYCRYMPYYSTCLWYLKKEEELNILAYNMKDNQSHLYEAYIVAGNWSKSTKNIIDASYWFKRASEIKPTDFYAHLLMGYEESDKDHFLIARKHFLKSINANRRSCLAWFALGSAYRMADEYKQAQVLLREANRLHTRQPVLLAALADVLYKLEEYEEAKECIDKAISISPHEEYDKLKDKIIHGLYF